jgi:hypothetical protein
MPGRYDDPLGEATGLPVRVVDPVRGGFGDLGAVRMGRIDAQYA